MLLQRGMGVALPPQGVLSTSQDAGDVSPQLFAGCGVTMVGGLDGLTAPAADIGVADTGDGATSGGVFDFEFAAGVCAREMASNRVGSIAPIRVCTFIPRRGVGRIDIDGSEVDDDDGGACGVDESFVWTRFDAAVVVEEE